MLHIGAVAHLVALDTCCTLVLLPIWWHWIHVAQRYCLPVWWQWIHILVLVQLMLIATRWLGDACSQVASFFMVTAVLSQLVMFALLGAVSSIAHAGHSMC